MTSLSFWVNLEKNITLENCKIILPDSIDDCSVGFGTVIHTGASIRQQSYKMNGSL